MKNKRLTYVLILVLLLIWGIIIRRVISYTASETPPLGTVRERAVPEAADPDYILRLDYRDPFGEAPPPRKAPLNTGKVEVLPENPEPIPEPPPIRFQGVIRQGKQSYAILEYGMHTGIFLPGDTLAGCRILSFTVDSMILKNGKHRYTLKPR